MNSTEYFHEKLRLLEIENYLKDNQKEIIHEIKSKSQKVHLTGLVCGDDAIALSGVTRPMFYAAKRFNPKEFPQEFYREVDSYIWYRKQDIIDFFEKHPARKQGEK
ncbi:hypothetical protein I6H07_10805 [Hafnia alvei]|uniref:hypothetical protein n=1 Tax=Hafnia alvei TaxID=569 RepID=UPI000B6D8ECE|nr:hypothetical protein [Hafnia alvei]MBI0276288.1 hypothetical protein [Hafnia alvei]PNK97189.1 hypothetical protein CEQ28_006015 [Hafnia alvei]